MKRAQLVDRIQACSRCCAIIAGGMLTAAALIATSAVVQQLTLFVNNFTSSDLFTYGVVLATVVWKVAYDWRHREDKC